MEPEESGLPENMEKRCEGVNQLVYWVTDNLLNDWIQLPDCRPEHIQVARQIKVVLTGDLNADVRSNPAFPGKERHLLRAQIARIFAATTICPAGAYAVDEETQKMKFAEEWTCPSSEELAKVENWQHNNKAILVCGRTNYFTPAGLDDEAKEALIEKLGAQDAKDKPELFKTAAEDKFQTPTEGFEAAWVSKTYGDSTTYTRAEEGGKTYSFAVNAIKSLIWPGAITVHKDGKWYNFYTGYAMKRGDSSYNPTVPPKIMSEPADPEQ